MDLAALRREYTLAGLHRADLAADPVSQFQKWFEQATQAQLLEPNAMSLATCGADGQPRVRTVLLKELDARGFVFYTNYESVKARQIAENPHASLLFPWLALERQVIVSGAVERLSSAESLRYFISRPLGSRLGAWASPQSQIISTRKLLQAKLEEVRRKFQDGEVPLPTFWGGYRVIPQSVEFWQGGESRLHDRFQYVREGDSWRIDRLAP